MKTPSHALPNLALCLILVSCGENELQERFDQAIDERQLLATEANASPASPGFDGLVKTTDGRMVYEMRDGKKDGSTVGVDQQGRKRVEGRLLDGKQHGTWTTYHPDGTLMWRGSKKNGVNHGPFVMWYPDGAKKMEGTFENGKKHGLSVIRRPNGLKWREERHKYGVPHGFWRVWDERGNLLEETFYQGGEPASAN